MSRSRPARHTPFVAASALLALALASCPKVDPPTVKALPMAGVATASPQNETALYLVVRDLQGKAVLRTAPGTQKPTVALTVRGPAGWNNNQPLEFRWPEHTAEQRPGVEGLYVIPTPPVAGTYTVTGTINGASLKPDNPSFTLASTEPVLEQPQATAESTAYNSVEVSVPNAPAYTRAEVFRGETVDGPLAGVGQEGGSSGDGYVGEEVTEPSDNTALDTGGFVGESVDGSRLGRGPARVAAPFALPSGLRLSAARVQVADGQLTVTTRHPLVKGETYTAQVTTSNFTGYDNRSFDDLLKLPRVDAAVRRVKIEATQGEPYTLQASVGRLFGAVNGTLGPTSTILTVRAAAPDRFATTSELALTVTGPSGSPQSAALLPGHDPALLVYPQRPTCAVSACVFNVAGAVRSDPGIAVAPTAAILSQPCGGDACVPPSSVTVQTFAPLPDNSGWTVALTGDGFLGGGGHLVYVRDPTASPQVVARARLKVNNASAQLKLAGGLRAGVTYQLVVLSTNAPLEKPTKEWDFGQQLDWHRQVWTSYVNASTADFAIALSPPSLAVQPGASGTVTVNVTRSGGFADAVTVGLLNPPAGISAAPLTIPAGAPSGALTVSLGTGAPASANVTVQATGGGLTRSATLAVSAAAAPDFSLSVSPPTLTIPLDSNGTATVSVARVGGFAGDVTVDIPNPPRGVFPQAVTIPAGGSSGGLFINTDNAVAGTYSVTVQGTGGGLTRTAPLTLELRHASGSLDASFNEGGVVTTDIGNGSSDSARAIAVQPDGKIVVAGSSSSSSGGRPQMVFALARYNPDGSLDSTFGTRNSGTVTIPFVNVSFGANAVALQKDGKIVVGGDADGDFALARYNPDGSPDQTFGDNESGTVTTSFGSGTAVVWALVLQGDKIVAAGRGNGAFALARYNPNGSLDDTFNRGGTVTTNFNRFETNVTHSVAAADLQGNKIVAVGYWSGNFALARYNDDGSLDSTFGGGTVTTPFGSSNGGAYAMAVQSDGRIVAAGISVDNAQNRSFALARYNPDGGLDSNFGSGGTVTTGFAGSGPVFASAVALQSDGKIVAAGTANNDLALVRYTADGKLDATFGVGGRVIANLGTNQNGAEDMVLQPDGKILVAGQGGSAATSDFVLLRYWP